MKLSSFSLRFCASIAVLFVIGAAAAWWLGENQPTRYAEVEYWSGLKDPNLSELEQGSLRQLEKDLRSIMVETVDFDDLPFHEAMSFLEQEIARKELDCEPIHFAFDPSASLDAPINLRLTNVPIAEVLRYLTSLNQCGYETLPERKIFIGSSAALGKTRRRDESGFLYVHASLYPTLTAPGPHDLKPELERAGVHFRSNDEALYYPEKHHLWVSLPRDQLELIDAYYASVCYLPDSTLIEKLKNRAYRLVGYDPYAFPVTPATPSAISTSGTTSTSTHPDPFGGGGANISEPDPFGGGATK